MTEEAKEAKLFDLLETKDFQALTPQEEAFVLSEMSASEYEQQRKLIIGAGTLGHDVIPAPLVIPAKTRILPLFLAASLSAAAAAILVFLLIPSKESIRVEFSFELPNKAIDTLIVENTVIDTVIDYRYVSVSDQKRQATSPSDIVENGNDDFRIPEYQQAVLSSQEIRTSEFVNKGISSARDEASERFRPKPFIGM